MEFILIHTPNNSLSRVMGPALIEMAKKWMEKPGEVMPGVKSLTAYAALGKMLNVTLCEAPSVENLMPALEQMNNLGWETEVIPAEKLSVKLDNVAKFMNTMEAWK